MILIPKIFHRIWIGSAKMPSDYVAWGETWLKHHPDWTMTLWTEKNLPPTRYPELMARCKWLAHRADIHRYEVLLKHGGVYVDCDFECKKNIEPIIDGADFFAAYQLGDKSKGSICNAFFGMTPNHPVMQEVLEEVPKRFDPNIWSAIGPYLITDVIHRHPEVRMFSPSQFYPYLWEEKHRRKESFPDAYAIHHWGSA